MTKVLRLIDTDQLDALSSPLVMRYIDEDAPEKSAEYKLGFIEGWHDCRRRIEFMPKLRMVFPQNVLGWINHKGDE